MRVGTISPDSKQFALHLKKKKKVQKREWFMLEIFMELKKKKKNSHTIIGISPSPAPISLTPYFSKTSNATARFSAPLVVGSRATGRFSSRNCYTNSRRHRSILCLLPHISGQSWRWPGFKLTNQNNLLYLLSALWKLASQRTRRTHTPVQRQSVPRRGSWYIFNQFSSPLSNTPSPPSLQKPASTWTPPHPRKEERVLRPLRLISPSSSHWNTKTSENHWISTGGSHGRSRLLFPSPRYEGESRRRLVNHGGNGGFESGGEDWF